MPKKIKDSFDVLAEVRALRQEVAELRSKAGFSATDRSYQGNTASAARQTPPKRKQPSAHSQAPSPRKSRRKVSAGHASSSAPPSHDAVKGPQYAPVYELKESAPVGFHPALPLDNKTLQSRAPAAEFLTGLADRTRLQWLLHDWESLAQMNIHSFSAHPERATIGALTASALFQLGHFDKAKNHCQAALRWDCDPKLLAACLAAGASVSLAQAHLLAGHKDKASRMVADSVPDQLSGSQIEKLMARDSLQSLSPPDHAQDSDSNLSPDAFGPTFLQKASSRFHRRGHKFSSVEKANQLNANGESLFRAGQYKMAAEYFQRAFKLRPRDAWVCQNLAEAVARLETTEATRWECEELGNAIAAVHKWEIAVRYYRLALKLSAETVAAHCDAQIFTVEPPQADHVPDPIFVVGCGHSGTSLMLAILGSHPQIHPIPKETALFLRTDKGVQESMRDFDKAAAEAGKKRWVEKTPPHIFQIHRFLAMRPASRFVVMIRDGRDVVCSLKHRDGYSDIEDRTERWIYDNMAADSYRGHSQVMFVKYEELVTDPENTIRRVCFFLGVEFSQSLLLFHETPRRWYSDYISKPASISCIQEHHENRNWQINQPLFDGRGRWIKDMSEEEKTYFKSSPAQNLLATLGYVNDAGW